MVGNEFAVWRMPRQSVISLAQKMSWGRQKNAFHLGPTFGNTEHEGRSAGVSRNRYVHARTHAIICPHIGTRKSTQTNSERLVFFLVDVKLLFVFVRGSKKRDYRMDGKMLNANRNEG
jgi:hypothetical protein